MDGISGLSGMDEEQAEQNRRIRRHHVSSTTRQISASAKDGLDLTHDAAAGHAAVWVSPRYQLENLGNRIKMDLATC